MAEYEHMELWQRVEGEDPLIKGIDQLGEAQKRLKAARLALRALAPNLSDSAKEDLCGVQYQLRSLDALLATCLKNLRSAKDD